MSDVQTTVRITPTVTGAASARQEIASIFRELRAGAQNVEELKDSLRDLGNSERAQARALGLMRTEYRNVHAETLALMGAFRGIASIGYTLTNIFKTHTLMQIRVADQTRDVRDTEIELSKVEAMRSQIVKDLGADSVYARRLMDEEDQLTKRLVEEKRDLSQAQQQNILGYAGIGLEAFRLIPNLEAVYKNSLMFKDLISDATWRAETLETLKTAAIAAKDAVLNIPTLVTVGFTVVGLAAVYEAGKGIEDMINKLKEETGVKETTPGGEPYDTTDKTIYYHGEPIGELEGGIKGPFGIVIGGKRTTVDSGGADVEVESNINVTVKPRGSGHKLR